MDVLLILGRVAPHQYRPLVDKMVEEGMNPKVVQATLSLQPGMAATVTVGVSPEEVKAVVCGDETRVDDWTLPVSVAHHYQVAISQDGSECLVGRNGQPTLVIE